MKLALLAMSIGMIWMLIRLIGLERYAVLLGARIKQLEQGDGPLPPITSRATSLGLRSDPPAPKP